MKKTIILVSLLTLTACGQLNTEDLPQPFKGRIVALRTDAMAQHRKCVDLQKQIAEMQAQANWDNGQIDVIAGEALLSVGKSPRDWKVNTDTLKIEKPQK